jgi:hypothetical protein
MKALLSGAALMFTSVYLKWLHLELYKEFGKQRGFESYEDFKRGIKDNLSFEKMFDNIAMMERLKKKEEKQNEDRDKKEDKSLENEQQDEII